MKTHITRVYKNGDKVSYSVLSCVVDDHLKDSIKQRFGCAHFKDGKCVSKGYLTEEECAKIESEVMNKGKPTLKMGLA